MKVLKKKVFNKVIFLFFAMMLIMVPFTFGVAALSVSEDFVLIEIEEEDVMVTMGTCPIVMITGDHNWGAGGTCPRSLPSWYCPVHRECSHCGVVRCG